MKFYNRYHSSGFYLVYGLLLLSTYAFDANAKDYLLDLDKQIKIQISDTGMNRIKVHGDRIKSVYGISDNFSLTEDSDLGDVFLVSRTENPFALTIVTEKGVAQDLWFEPKEIKSQLVTLREQAASPTSAASIAQDINQVIKLAKKTRLKKLAGEVSLMHGKSLRARELGYDVYGQYRVKVYVVENISKDKQDLLPQQFQFTYEIKATALDAVVLKPGEVTKLYTVEDLS